MLNFVELDAWLTTFVWREIKKRNKWTETTSLTFTGVDQKQGNSPSYLTRGDAEVSINNRKQTSQKCLAISSNSNCDLDNASKNYTTLWPERTMAQCIQQIFFDPRSSKVILLHPVQLRVALKQQRSNKQTCMGSFGNRSSSVVNNCKHMIPRQWDSTWSVGFFSKVSVRPKSLYLTQCVT